MILLIDFESTGLDPKTARILEIGAMVTDEAFNEPEAGMSQLVWESGYPALTPDVIKVTNITQDMLSAEGISFDRACHILGNITRGVDITGVIAYNRKYDQVLFQSELLRTGLSLDPEMNRLAQLPWLCAMEDFEGNYAFKSWRLMHVALEYGVTVNPKLLHRAIADVELMRQMLQASGTTPTAMWAWQTTPWMYVAAKVNAPWTDGGKTSNEAKALGFRWQTTGDDRVFEKTWVKKIKPKQYEELLNKATFSIREIL